MSEETQPLVEEPSEEQIGEHVGLNDRIINPELQAEYDQALQRALSPSLVRAFNEAVKPKPKPKEHKHGPFTFLLNQNHNALRGCTTCGAAWVGFMAGTPDTLHWHPVAEIDEEEEE